MVVRSLILASFVGGSICSHETLFWGGRCLSMGLTREMDDLTSPATEVIESRFSFLWINSYSLDLLLAHGDSYRIDLLYIWV